MSTQNATNYLHKYLVMICLGFVALIGIGVIIGWHTHILFLVQVIGGAIPMQYNTALCFILLSISAGVTVLRKNPGIVPAVGSSLVSLIGCMVVFQYITGISLGIDTLFFYPWNQTLSADPGRMALTTALSFAVAGGTLCLLILRPKTLIAFVLAHTFPLSLGMTSLLGYVFGITYVLPFHLGSQMAVHTALAFTIYGGAMLFCTWKHIPKTHEGLPTWVPAIAVVVVPIFFVTFISSLQNNSTSALIGQFILAAAGTVLLALAMHKIMQTRIVYKGLTLISIPLLFVLGFVVLVNQQKRTGERTQAMAMHSKEIITHTHLLSEYLVEAESNIRGYTITGDADYLERYTFITGRFLEEGKILLAAASDNPQQSKDAGELVNKAKERAAVLDEIKTLLAAGKQDEAVARVKSGTGKRLMQDFHTRTDVFLADAERLDDMRDAEARDSWQRFDWLLVAGTSADLLLAFSLAFLFSRGIGRRLQILTDNAQALAGGKRLALPLTGTDEIARLDLVFHQMAEALQKAHGELESKVEERTDELSAANEKLKEQIAERRKAEDNLAMQRVFLRQIIDLNPSFIFAKDRRGCYTLVNQSFAEAHNARVEDFQGKTDNDFGIVPDLVKDYDRENLQVIETGRETFVAEKEFIDAYGDVHWLQVTKRPMYMPDGTIDQVLAIGTDITERRWVAEEIKKMNASLERRVAERTTQLEAANKELESFSYSVSHDLRTPLRAIDGFSRIIVEDYHDKFDDEGRRLLGIIRNNAQKMGHLIDDLLAFSRLGRKQVELSTIDMSGLAQDVLVQFETEANGPNTANVTIGELPPASGDKALLRQVFVNLISNAIKYSGTKENTPVEIGGEKSETGENVYYVRDHGVGFDMKYANKLFGVFQRLHTADQFEGTGVGLAIVQRIVHRHGGRIWAEAEIDKGATFYFTLPQDRSNSKEEKDNEPQ